MYLISSRQTGTRCRYVFNCVWVCASKAKPSVPRHILLWVDLERTCLRGKKPPETRQDIAKIKSNKEQFTSTLQLGDHKISGRFLITAAVQLDCWWSIRVLQLYFMWVLLMNWLKTELGPLRFVLGMLWFFKVSVLLSFCQYWLKSFCFPSCLFCFPDFVNASKFNLGLEPSASSNDLFCHLWVGFCFQTQINMCSSQISHEKVMSVQWWMKTLICSSFCCC